MDYWLGIYTDDHQNWRNLFNDPIEDDLLQWIPGQPNESGKELNYHDHLVKKGKD